MSADRSPFAIFWYVRSDSHVYDYDGAVVDIEAAKDSGDSEADVVRRWRGKLLTPSALREAKREMRSESYISGRVRAVRVSVYRKN